MALRFSPARGTASLVLNALTRGPAGAAATIAAGANTALVSGAAPTVTNSGTSSAATFDFGIPAGIQPGLRFTFSTDITDADPGAGMVRFNNATISSVTEIYIDNAEFGTANISAILDLLDDATATTSATLMFVGELDPTDFAFFKVTGSVVDAAGYRRITVSGGVGSANPPFANSDRFSMGFALGADNGALANVVEDTTPQLGGFLDGQGEDIAGIGVLTLVEQAAAEAGVAGRGQLWVKTATPNELWFTDDAGTDFQLATLAGTETLTNKTIDLTDNILNGTLAEFNAAVSDANIQVQDAVLDDLAALPVVADNEIIVGTGAGAYAHEGGATARTSLGLAIGTDVQAFDADTLKADTADVLTAGFASTVDDDGTKSSGTYTPDEAGGNVKRAVNGGAHTLAPPSNDGTIIVQYTNNASAGAITTSGFTLVDGDAVTTANGDDFFFFIVKDNGFSSLTVKALQ